MTQKKYFILLLLIIACSYSFSIAPKNTSANSQTTKDTVKKTDPSSVVVPDDAVKTQQELQSAQQNNLQIDTALNRTPAQVPQQTVIPVDSVKKIDSTQISSLSENAMTNTKLFIYILLSVLGLALFFYIFVITLFKTFHKKKSTRQSLLLSWNLFFIVTIIWIFIIWGLVAGFWTVASFMIVVIFLFIISLIMTIIAIKSK
ncbi:MAG TPA: hypothetical protein PKC91_11730 [Ignavibacteria bacterium]|nr:hypothetical protein [Ignavibacteria bacterium]